MGGLFFIDGMRLRETKVGTHAMLVEYLRERGVDTVAEDIRIFSCKGLHRTTAIPLETIEAAQNSNTIIYLGVTKNTQTMLKQQWTVYQLECEKLMEEIKERYPNPDKSDPEKNYRMNVGWDYAHKEGRAVLCRDLTALWDGEENA